MFGKDDTLTDKTYQANPATAGDGDFMSGPQPTSEVTQAFTPEPPIPQEFEAAPTMDAPQAPAMPEAVAEAAPEPVEAAPQYSPEPELAQEQAQPDAPSFSAHFGTPTNDPAQYHPAPPAEPEIVEDTIPSFSEAQHIQEEAPAEPVAYAPEAAHEAAPEAMAEAEPAPAQEGTPITNTLAVLQSPEAQSSLTGNGPIKSAQLEHLLAHAEQGNTGAQHALLIEGLGLLSDVAASSSNPDFGQELKATTVALLDEGVISPIGLESQQTQAMSNVAGMMQQQAQQQNAKPEPRKPMSHQETVENAREMNRLSEENGVHTGQYL